MGGGSIGKHPTEKWLYFALAFVGGYGDAASFVLTKTFTGHITGSLVLAAIALAAHKWSSMAVHASAVLFFLIGVFASVRIERALVARPAVKSLPALLIVEAFLTLAAYIALVPHAIAGVEVFVVCMSLALGIQNGAFQGTGGISVHTTYLTGMITGLVTAEAKKTSSTTRDPTQTLLYGIWAAFVAGGTVGAVLALHFREEGVLGVTLLLIAIIAFQTRTRTDLRQIARTTSLKR
jgi:uncharacterized membrane protein YoaK (UPF0700 family)